MHLLAINLQKPSAINFSAYGNFSTPKSQEIVVAKGNILELLRPDKSGKILTICSTSVFASIRSLLPFRLAGANKDYLIITSDSGKVSIVEYDTSINDWKLVHCEPYGKTGCRRIVPGQYTAADPKGRAILIAAVEKQRFVYVMNRDSSNKLTISSPLEAHKSECILFSVCGVDVGFDNPIFAMIELDYTEADQDPTGEAVAESEKKLTYYELDLGLNHVVRKWSEPISRTANLLLTVPGGDDGPSGVLICGENWISYKHQGHIEIRAPIPRRHDYPKDRGLLIVTGTLHRQKDLFFYLVQSEIGDVYKVTLHLDENDRKIVTDIHVTVFDSIQLANGLCITKTGLLFVASEFGNHSLYQFQGIGDDPKAIIGSRILDDEINEQLGDDAISASQVAPIFYPSTKLKNLLLIDEISSLAPITDMMIDDLVGEETPQIITLCGRGHRSSLRMLRHGVSVTEMAVSDLPGRANAVWTVKGTQSDAYDRYIIVSMQNSTLVLSVGDTVEEITDSGFLGTTSTLQVVLLDDNALLQVHPKGIRHIRQDKRLSEWKSPGGKTIEKSAVNSRQVVISLAGGEIIYFELDMTGQLMEMGSHEFGKEISALDLGIVPPGRVQSPFLAVGCYDDTVQLLSLNPTDLLVSRANMNLNSRPESLCLVLMHSDVSRESSSSATSASSSKNTPIALPTLYLNVGLASGVLVRVAVDSTTGALTDQRLRFLGPRSVKLFRIPFMNTPGVMALTKRPWVMYSAQGRYFQSPVSYETLEYVHSFTSEQCPEGIVAVAGSTLRIITIDNLGDQFNQNVIPLRYTPRKMSRLPNSRQIVMIESDHNEYNELERNALQLAQNTDKQLTIENHHPTDMAVDHETVDPTASTNGGSHTNGNQVTKPEEGGDGPAEGDEEDEDVTTLPVRGPMPPTDGKWASCVRVLEPSTGTTLDLLELTNNEAAISICTCKLSKQSDETFIVVGIVKDFIPMLKKATSYCLKVYRIIDSHLQFIHQTDIDDLPQIMTEFQGKLLVGIGKSLRLYEMGKRKLLLKCENKMFPVSICKLLCSGDRIFVGDMAESIHYVKYKRMENTLSIFADDTFPRFTTALCLLDYDTVVAGDKFGNIYILRLPEGASDNVEVATGVRQLWDLGILSGAPIKLECLTHYYIGEAITSIVKKSMVLGGPEVIIASTIMGSLYAFIPFTVKDDVTFYQHLEMFMRQEFTNLCQRDHLSYRSYFVPVKDTIDGELCEKFSALSSAKQQEFGADVDRTPAEILKKLEDTRNIM